MFLKTRNRCVDVIVCCLEKITTVILLFDISVVACGIFGKSNGALVLLILAFLYD